MVNPKKLTILFVLISMLALTSIISVSGQGIMAEALSPEMMIMSPEDMCCQQYGAYDEMQDIDSEQAYNKVAPSSCCDMTTDPDACYACIDEYVYPVRTHSGSNSGFLYVIIIPLFWIFLLVGTIAVLLLVIHGIVKLASETKKGFLSKGWLIALWIIFGVTFILNIILFWIFITMPIYY